MKYEKQTMFKAITTFLTSEKAQTAYFCIFVAWQISSVILNKIGA